MGFDPMGIVTAGMDYLQGQANAKAARDAFRSRYQDTVRDMKKAGLNPALAYGQGGGNPVTHDVPLPGEQLAKATGAFSSAKQAAAAAQNLGANTEKTKAETGLLNAQAADLVQKIKLENQALQSGIESTQAGTRLTGERITGQQLENVLTGKRTEGQAIQNEGQRIANAIAALDQQLRANDVSYSNATLPDRINRLHNEAVRSKLDISKELVEIALLRAQQPKANLIASGAEGLRQGIQTLAETAPRLLSDDNLSGNAHDIFNRAYHYRNQKRAALHQKYPRLFP